MDRRSKILLAVVVFLIVLSVAASYYRFMILHDYIVEAQIDCDPSLESCFIWQCDPSVEGECTGNTEEDIWYYKIAHRKATNMTGCATDDTECQFTCSSNNESGCGAILCGNDSLDTYGTPYRCTDRIDFQIDNENGFEELESP